MTTTIATNVRQSPFRETEWDRRLDNMLEDLENSAAANSGGGRGTASSSSSMQQHQSMSNVSHQLVAQSTSQSSSTQQQQRSASTSAYSHQASSAGDSRISSGEATTAAALSTQQNGYGSVLQKSKSGSSLAHENTDHMLKEMDTALKASTNYIESHRSSQSVGPSSRSAQEYHEYRSYTNGGTNRGTDGGDFNLERQVQHMMPPPSPSLSRLMERSNES